MGYEGTPEYTQVLPDTGADTTTDGRAAAIRNRQIARVHVLVLAALVAAPPALLPGRLRLRAPNVSVPAHGVHVGPSLARPLAVAEEPSGSSAHVSLLDEVVGGVGRYSRSASRTTSLEGA